MRNTADTIDAIKLNDMPYAPGARYTEEKGCLPGTRESVLREICDVLSNPDQDAPQVCLLTGIAGSGKSAIAHSIARLYDEQKRLGSSYYFSSSDVARRNPQNLFTTIARDLADTDSQYKSALWKVVKDNRALCISSWPSEQIERLIVEPSAHLDAIGPLVIVIDALDESGSADDRRQLLDALSRHLTKRKLPSNLRFLIASRPEADIVDALSTCSSVVCKYLGDVPDAVIDKDIGTFIRHSLHQYTELESSWPNQEWYRLLVRHSQHLFQWAATACRFIQGIGSGGLDRRKRMEVVLGSDNNDFYRPLDDLYHKIIGQLFPLDEGRECFREVMALLLTLKEPLSLMSLSALFDSNEDLNMHAIIKPMGSLLDGVLDEEKPIRPLHTSFRDFLLDEARSHAFHIHIIPNHSLFVGQALLACMCGLLRFNICDLKDSRLCNTVVPNLVDQVNKAIPPWLSYACLYWMDHLQCASCTPDLLNEVTLFFKCFFPYWLEAISLLSLSSPLSTIVSALETCTILMTWAKVRCSLLTDAGY